MEFFFFFCTSVDLLLRVLLVVVFVTSTSAILPITLCLLALIILAHQKTECHHPDALFIH